MVRCDQQVASELGRVDPRRATEDCSCEIEEDWRKGARAETHPCEESDASTATGSDYGDASPLSPSSSYGSLAECSRTQPPSKVRFAAPERAVLGVLQIATDVNMDTEGAMLVARLPGVNVRFAKIAFDHETICADTYEDAFAKGYISAAVKTISMPAGYITMWGVGCTSLSFILGTERLQSQLPPGAPLCTMWDGVRMALQALAVKRVAVLTPYLHDVHDKNVALMEEEGLVVTKSMNLNLSTDRQTSAVQPEFIAECTEMLCAPGDVDAVFLGCSAFRACTPGFISSLEERVGVPVVTSTQAFYWHALRSAGVQDALEGYGRLFLEH